MIAGIFRSYWLDSVNIYVEYFQPRPRRKAAGTMPCRCGNIPFFGPAALFSGRLRFLFTGPAPIASAPAPASRAGRGTLWGCARTPGTQPLHTAGPPLRSPQQPPAPAAKSPPASHTRCTQASAPCRCLCPSTPFQRQCRNPRGGGAFPYRRAVRFRRFRRPSRSQTHRFRWRSRFPRSPSGTLPRLPR